MRNFAARRDNNLDSHRVWRTLARDVPHLRAYLADVISLPSESAGPRVNPPTPLTAPRWNRQPPPLVGLAWPPFPTKGLP